MVDFIKYDDTRIEPSTKVLKKDVYAKYLEAQELVEIARNEAKELRRLSSASYKKQKRDGRAAGLEQAKVEVDKKLVKLSNLAIENLRDIEDSIAEIVSYCVKAIIGDIDNEFLIAKVVAKKMEDLQQSQTFTVIVNPVNNVEVIQHYLVNHLGVESFYLKHDSSLLEGQMIIDTALGTINTTIENEVLMVTDEVEDSSLPMGKAI